MRTRLPLREHRPATRGTPLAKAGKLALFDIDGHYDPDRFRSGDQSSTAQTVQYGAQRILAGTQPQVQGMAVDAKGDNLSWITSTNKYWSCRSARRRRLFCPSVGSSSPTEAEATKEAWRSTRRETYSTAAANGVFEMPAGSTGQVVLPFSVRQPDGITVDAAGDVFVTSWCSATVFELPAGSTQQVELPIYPTTSDQAMEQGDFTSIAVDQAGDVFVNQANATSALELPAKGTQVELTNLPYLSSIAVDAAGDMYGLSGNLFEQPAGSTTATSLPVGAGRALAVSSHGAVYLGVENGLQPGLARGADKQRHRRGACHLDRSTGSKLRGRGRGRQCLHWRHWPGGESGLQLRAGSSHLEPLPFSGLGHVNSVAVDERGDVVVSDWSHNQILELPAGSDQQIVLPFQGLLGPMAVAIDAAGDVYTADAGFDRTSFPPEYISRVIELPVGSNTQVVLAFSGLTLDGPSAGLAVGTAGDVFVADTLNNRVLELPAGSDQQIVMPFQPVPGYGGPSWLTVNSQGDVYAVFGPDLFELAAGSDAQVSVPFDLPFGTAGTAVDAGSDVYAIQNEQVSGADARLYELPNLLAPPPVLSAPSPVVSVASPVLSGSPPDVSSYIHRLWIAHLLHT